MLQLGAYVTIPDLSKVDIRTLIAGLRFHAPELGQEILDRIEARTPVDTGALVEDEAYIVGGSDPRALVTWFVGDEWQYTEWNREYSVYQEGPPLGIEGYTSTGKPWKMFEQIETTDLPIIQAWAEASVQEGIDQMVKDATAGARTFP